MSIETVKDKRSPLWLRLLLIGSLAVNVLIISFFVGALLRHGPSGHSQQGRGLEAAFYFGSLSQEDRRTIMRQLRRDHGAPAEYRRKLLTEAEQTIALLRAETVDREALAQAIQRQRGYLSQRHKDGDRVFVDHVAGMSYENRQNYADRLEDRLKHSRPYRR